MPRRRVWSALSTSYRARLQRKGVTQAQYESGVSLKAARGHAQTPESPAEYARHPDRFKRYRENRKGLVQRIQEKKDLLFGDRHKYDEKRSRRYVKEGDKENEILPPTMKQLRFLDSLTLEEFDDWQYEHREDDDWGFLWYH